MVSWVPGKRTSGPSGAVSFLALAMKSFGSSGGGALVGANEGAVAVALGSPAVDGSCEDGWSEAEPVPSARGPPPPPTAAATATVASAPAADEHAGPVSRSRR
ncbi:hypothetical protein SFUMM280S_05006 [Streptomyces fumanus]